MYLTQEQAIETIREALGTDRDFITTAELARLVRKNPDTLRRQLSRESVNYNAIKLGRTTHISVADAARFMESESLLNQTLHDRAA